MVMLNWQDCKTRKLTTVQGQLRCLKCILTGRTSFPEIQTVAVAGGGLFLSTKLAFFNKNTVPPRQDRAGFSSKANTKKTTKDQDSE